MKIGIVLSNTPTYSETFFISKIKGLEKNGHEVMLFTQSKIDNFNLCKVKKAYPINKRNLFKQFGWIVIVFLKLVVHPKPVLKFVRLEKKYKTKTITLLKKLYTNAHLLTEKLDWLHFGFATMALGKEHVAESIGAKMAVSLRGYDIAIYPVKHPECYQLLWEKVDKVHTISDDLYELALKNGLSRHIPFQKITPAIETGFFKNLNVNELTNTKFQLLTVARLHWKKGLSYTLRALAILKNKGFSFEYTLIGEGELYEELMYTIHLLNLSDCVFLVGGKSSEEVKNIMALNQYYIQYSISEGFCNAVLEAQAMGLLCIVSDAEGLAENVLDKLTGWVVPKRNPELLAQQLIQVVNMSTEEKAVIKKNAIKRVQAAFNIQKQEKEFLVFYE